MDTILKILGIFTVGKYLLNRAGTAILNRIDIGRVTATNTRFDLATNMLTMNLNVELVNNSPVSVPVTSFKGVLRYGSLPISDILYTTPTTVPSQSVQNFTLDVRTPVDALINNLSELISTNTFYNNLIVQGNLVVNGREIYPITKNIISLG